MPTPSHIASVSTVNDLDYTAISTTAPITPAGRIFKIPVKSFLIRVDFDVPTAGLAIDPTKLLVAMKRPGFDGTRAPLVGNARWDDTARGTIRLRQPYPDHAGASFAPGPNGIYVVMDNAIHGSDEITSLTLEAGFYNDGAPSPQIVLAGGSITRLDNKAYPGLSVQLAELPYQRRTGAFTVEIAGTHDFARGGKPFACVQAWARSGGVDGAIATQTTPSLSRHAPAIGTPSQVRQPNYSLTVDPAGLADSTAAVVRYRAYPQVGDVWFESTIDGAALPTADPYSELPFTLDAAGAFTPIYAHINDDPTVGLVGTDDSGIRTNAADPGGAASYRTAYDAARAACIWNNKIANRPGGAFNNTNGLVIIARPVAGSVAGADAGSYAVHSAMTGAGVTIGSMPVEIRSTSGLPTDDVRFRSVTQAGAAPTSKIIAPKTLWRGIHFDTIGLATGGAAMIVLDVNGATTMAATTQHFMTVDCKVRSAGAASANATFSRSGIRHDIRMDQEGDNSNYSVGGTFGVSSNCSHMAMSIGSRYHGVTTAFLGRCMLAAWFVKSRVTGATPAVPIGHPTNGSGTFATTYARAKTILFHNLRQDHDYSGTERTVNAFVQTGIHENVGIVNILVRKALSAALVTNNTEGGALTLWNDGNMTPVPNVVAKYIGAAEGGDATRISRKNISYQDAGFLMVEKLISVSHSAIGQWNTKTDPFGASAISTTWVGTAAGWTYLQGDLVKDASNNFYQCRASYTGTGATDYSDAPIAGDVGAYWVNLGTGTAVGPQPQRTGNWRSRYHVRDHYNVVSASNDNPGGPIYSPTSWLGEVKGRGWNDGPAMSTFYVNDTGGPAAGSSPAGFATWGDYTPHPTGPLLNMVPAGMSAVSHDLYGNPRLNDGTGAAGPIERGNVVVHV